MGALYDFAIGKKTIAKAMLPHSSVTNGLGSAIVLAKVLAANTTAWATLP
jgi:hypothetical protein